MRLRPIVVVFLPSVLAACAAVLGLPDPTLDETVGGGSSSGTSSSSGSAGGDGAIDGPLGDSGDGSSPSNFCMGPWFDAGRLGGPPDGGVNTNGHEVYPSLNDDESSITFARVEVPTFVEGVWSAFRSTTAEPFGPATNVTALVPGKQATSPCVVGPRNDLSLWTAGQATTTVERFYVDAASGLYETTPQQGPATPPFARAMCRTLVADASVMYVHGESSNAVLNANTAAFLFRAPRSGPDSWGDGVPVTFDGGDGGSKIAPVVRSDELEIFFAQYDGNQVGWEIYTATRDSVTDPFREPKKVSFLSGNGPDIPGWLSPDGCRLYLSRDLNDAGLDLWVATRSKQ